jgi:hypothetical protein
MDHSRFDRLSQTLATTSHLSRRGVLAALGVALLGTVAGVDPEAASAKGRSRKQSKGKRRHHATSRQHGTRGQLTASGIASSESDCRSSGAGATCQAATCVNETTMHPACTCDAKGRCKCPQDYDVVCANHLTCRNGACLTGCLDHDDCSEGFTCNPQGQCVIEFICDCSNHNNCSGHGICTETCTCRCDDGWSGASCSDQPAKSCGDYTSCDTCATHLLEGCTWCLETLDGEADVCTRGELCVAPLEVCSSRD